jgi:hypothetical protein
MDHESTIHDREVGIEGRPCPRLCADDREQLPPERIAEFRLRIAAGIYQTPTIIDAVARGIAGSADL